MPERISKTEHQYAGRDLSKGDKLEVEPQDMPLLLALGRIEPEQGEPGHDEYRARDMTTSRADDQANYRTRHIPSAPRKKRKAA